MKILITGKDSYIGTSFEKWLAKDPSKYHVDAICVKSDDWKIKDFSSYDVVFHVAGIAHIKETKRNRSLYFRVNRDLSYEVARKAKQDGVKHFVFLSSISVFGLSDGIISKETPTKPINSYGKSKLEAEQLIVQLETAQFRVAIIRPPMVYGYGCKGNYPRLVNLIKKTPVFPDYPNQRSMIFVDNLSEIIRNIIDTNDNGRFHPQNSDFVSTKDLVQAVSWVYEKNILFTRTFNWIIPLAMKVFASFRKVFGTLVYSEDLSIANDVVAFQDSICRSELVNKC